MKPSSIKILRQELAEYYDINTKSYTHDRIVKESHIMLKQLRQSKRRLRSRTHLIENYLDELREILRPYKDNSDEEELNFRKY